MLAFPRRLRTAFAIAVTAAIAVANPAAADVNSGAELTLQFPQDVAATYFLDSWGWSRPGGRGHRGNDLMADKMAPVYAAADGVVERVADSGMSGRYLVIDHGDGWETYYLHLNDDDPGTDNGAADWSLTLGPGIEEGARVAAGQHIGYVGDSGNAEGTDPHTHFELHHGGSAIDPYPYLETAYRVALAAAAAGIDPGVNDVLTELGESTWLGDELMFDLEEVVANLGSV